MQDVFIRSKEFSQTSLKNSMVALSFLTILAVFISPLITAAEHDPYGSEVVNKVTLCHDESGDGTGYHSSGGIAVSAALNGHTQDTPGQPHYFDIIPPFHYKDGGTTTSYPGQNWNETTEDIWNNGECDGDGIINPPVDECPNLEGDQATIPDGMVKDEQGNCITPEEPIDVCPEDDGIQTSLDECTDPDQDPETVTIIATKIVCDNEADLPNWGTGGPDITTSTASVFLAEHENCRAEPGWEFEWGPSSSFDPGDTITGPAGDPWNTFGPTDVNGVATIEMTAEQIGENPHLWFREVLQEGYLVFSHDQNENSNADNVSAEIYCHIDVLNFDNYDRVDGITLGETYYCVAFNVLVEEEPEVGILTIIKVILNGSDEDTADDFSFQINGGSAIQFEADGSNDVVLDLADGPFTVVEVDSLGFVVGYSGCTNVVLTEQGAVCTITNRMPVEEEGPFADIEIVKDVNNTTVESGNEAIFTLTVTNNGPDDATNVVATDVLPVGLVYLSHNTATGAYDKDTGDWTIGDIANGASAVLEITVTVDQESGDIVNNSNVSGSEEDPNIGNNSDAASINIEEDNGGGGGGGGGGSSSGGSSSSGSSSSSSGSVANPPGEVLGAATEAPGEVLGLPRTGAGGGAMLNIMLLVMSGLTAIWGGSTLKRA